MFWGGGALAQLNKYAKVQRGLLSALLIFYPISSPNLLFLPKNIEDREGKKNSTCLHYKSSIYARMLLWIGEKRLIPC